MPDWSPEHRQERIEWRAQDEALKKRIKEGSITGQDAATERQRLDEWYKDWQQRVMGHDRDGPGSA